MRTEELHTLLEKLVQTPGEQTWLEFKTDVAKQNASVTPEGIGEYISSLSNGACIANKDFGYLVLGVEDETQKIVGTNFKPSHYKIGNRNFEYQHKTIVLFRIPSAKAGPVNFQKKPFIRINSQKTDLLNFPAYVRNIYNSL